MKEVHPRIKIPITKTVLSEATSPSERAVENRDDVLLRGRGFTEGPQWP